MADVQPLLRRDRFAGPHRPHVFAGLDRIFRSVGGAPTHLLTDNEKTVTTGQYCRVPVRNRAAVTFGRDYGISVLTCEPADPASKGGAENAVKLAKADIVPTETNLLPRYDSFADVEAACAGPRSTPGPTAPRGGAPSRCSPQNAPPCTPFPTCRIPPRWV